MKQDAYFKYCRQLPHRRQTSDGNHVEDVPAGKLDQKPDNNFMCLRERKLLS